MVSELRPTIFLLHPISARWKLNTGETKNTGLPLPPAPSQRAIFWQRQEYHPFAPFSKHLLRLSSLCVARSVGPFFYLNSTHGMNFLSWMWHCCEYRGPDHSCCGPWGDGFLLEDVTQEYWRLLSTQTSPCQCPIPCRPQWGLSSWSGSATPMCAIVHIPSSRA